MYIHTHTAECDVAAFSHVVDTVMVLICKHLTTLGDSAPWEVAARNQRGAFHLETLIADVPNRLLFCLIAQSRRVVIVHRSIAVALRGRTLAHAVVAKVHQLVLRVLHDRDRTAVWIIIFLTSVKIW